MTIYSKSAGAKVQLQRTFQIFIVGAWRGLCSGFHRTDALTRGPESLPQQEVGTGGP